MCFVVYNNALSMGQKSFVTNLKPIAILNLNGIYYDIPLTLPKFPQ